MRRRCGVDCGLIATATGCWDVLSLMHHNLTERAVAGFITRVEGPGLPAARKAGLVAVPDWAAARGVCAG